ncbi:asparagine synthase (glutamine-hydrolyzing) [Tahibacter amnicola]|uniref:asparagine synthase (glutamine-hydrolyzing) n=1 Tax=Tahibacter amnicola TaxID=2976241 RepID=A0ABY6BF14_9GAMM|nr:asparagine synthase (glutamine-hydrolyzing) [Tahibacter amnicola]UXI67700.1 asparagine synthase (glutamine-hydrolyzing) [Tahibacter amnicola]
MCGISFLYDPSPVPERGSVRSRSAIAAMAYRGPDEIGFHDGDTWYMGQARLAIIGLVDGQQPMADPSGRWWLTYNGEVYNYKEVRAELGARWTFRTQSDTEVVLAGLILEGASFLRRLNGMWALALWDTCERTLLLARDRLGKKPLYFQAGPTQFACASELPALQKLLPARQRRVDRDSMADILRYGFAMPGRTVQEDVGEVLPGHVLHWSPGRAVEQASYWSLSTLVAAPATGHDVLELLTSAVKYRLVADVEVGAFLSGGIDSSLVSAIAARHCDHPLRTFSIGFSEASFDETAHARRMAEYLGTRHESQVFAAPEVAHMARLVVGHIGMPFGDASLLPTAAVSALAAGRVKVALSGDGADELFAGYQRYLGRLLLRWYSRLPIGLQKTAERLLGALPEPLHHHSSSYLKKAKLFARSAALSRHEGETGYVAPRIFSDAEIARLAPDVAGRGHRTPALPERANGDDLLQMMMRDALVYLPQDILVKTDRASMAYSLEQRSPFLDYRLVELALSQDSGRHFRGLRGKALLRESVRALAPSWLWRRRKQGFAVPLGTWFRGEMGDALLRESRRAEQWLLDPAHVTRLVEEHRKGDVDHGQRLWLLWTCAIWQTGLQETAAAQAEPVPAPYLSGNRA